MSAAMDIDKPLDEIIKSKPKVRRGGSRPGNRAPAAASGNGARERYAGKAPRSAPTASTPKTVGGDAVKIIISSLPGDVTEAAVRDLMQSTVGPVRSVNMSYNAAGKSTGVATVIFKNRGDGNKAHGTYNNRMIDNQRPMKVEIIVDPSQVQSLAARVAPPSTRGKDSGRGGRRGTGRTRAPRPVKKSAEELDAEMSAYKDSSAA